MTDEKTIREAEVYRIAWVVGDELDKIEANWLETAMLAELIRALSVRVVAKV